VKGKIKQSFLQEYPDTGMKLELDIVSSEMAQSAQVTEFHLETRQVNKFQAISTHLFGTMVPTAALRSPEGPHFSLL